MLDLIKKAVSQEYELVPRDVGSFAVIKKNGMKFWVESYEVKGLGNISFIKMSAMLGLMKMDTCVFTPLTKDTPLYSFDYINAMGNDTLLLELYDTCLTPCDASAFNLIKEKYAFLPDNDLGKHWYDSIKLPQSLSKKGKKLKETYTHLVEEYTMEYLRLLQQSGESNPDAKREHVKAYTDGLFSNGGPSTDQFKKMLGAEKARELFEKYVFASVKD